MEFEDILKHHVGQLGRFQIVMLLFISIGDLFSAFYTMSSVFLVGTPEHHCKIHFKNLSNKAQYEFLRLVIPPDPDGKLSSCEMYDWNYTNLVNIFVTSNTSDGTVQSNSTQEFPPVSRLKCQEWVYDDSLYSNTMVTDWDLVCDRQYLASSVATMYMVGNFLGCLVLGPITDWVGRKPVVLVAGIVQVLCGVAIALVPNITAVLVLRVFMACCGLGQVTAGIIMATEFVGPDWRVFTTTVFSLYWVTGYILLAGIAYLIPDWRTLQLVTTVPQIVYFIIFIFLVPESPRWLLTKNRKKEAKVIVHKMARWNKTECPEDMDITLPKKKKMGTFLDLFRTPGIRRVTLILWVAWFTCGFVYYGLSLNTSNLGGNPYINFMIAGAVEAPAYIIMFRLVRRFGRVYPYVVSSLTVGVSLLLIMAIPKDIVWLIITVSMIGKFAITCALNFVWFYSMEVYPTIIRSNGTNYASLLARIGAVLATYVEMLANIHPSLHFAVFGVCAVVSGILALGFPETLGAPLTQTVAQAEAFMQADTGKLCFRKLKRHQEVEEAEHLKPMKSDLNKAEPITL